MSQEEGGQPKTRAQPGGGIALAPLDGSGQRGHWQADSTTIATGLDQSHARPDKQTAPGLGGALQGPKPSPGGPRSSEASAEASPTPVWPRRPLQRARPREAAALLGMELVAGGCCPKTSVASRVPVLRLPPYTHTAGGPRPVWVLPGMETEGSKSLQGVQPRDGWGHRGVLLPQPQVFVLLQIWLTGSPK